MGATYLQSNSVSLKGSREGSESKSRLMAFCKNQEQIINTRTVPLIKIKYNTNNPLFVTQIAALPSCLHHICSTPFLNCECPSYDLFCIDYRVVLHHVSIPAVYMYMNNFGYISCVGLLIAIHYQHQPIFPVYVLYCHQ